MKRTRKIDCNIAFFALAQKFQKVDVKFNRIEKRRTARRERKLKKSAKSFVRSYNIQLTRLIFFNFNFYKFARGTYHLYYRRVGTKYVSSPTAPSVYKFSRREISRERKIAHEIKSRKSCSWRIARSTFEYPTRTTWVRLLMRNLIAKCETWSISCSYTVRT